MTEQQIKGLLDKQRKFYKSGTTIPVKFRIEQLKKLYSAVKKYQTEVNDALTSDLGKSHFEGFMCESGLVLSEISYMIRHTKRFAKRKTVATPITNFASHSFKQPVPYGNTLIMSPWNYPFLLTIDPLADAVAGIHYLQGTFGRSGSGDRQWRCRSVYRYAYSYNQNQSHST